MALSKIEIRDKYKSQEDFFSGELGRHTCACGCKQLITLKKSHFWNGIPKYVFGHAARLRVGTIHYDETKFYSVRDIARIGNVSEQTVRLWVRHGDVIVAKTVGRKNLFVKKDIDSFLSSRKFRSPFDRNMYVTVTELKRMGVSRRKLRRLVREGAITEPRIYRRETNYYRPEIEKYLDTILEEISEKLPKSRLSNFSIEELLHHIKRLETKLENIESLIRKR